MLIIGNDAINSTATKSFVVGPDRLILIFLNFDSEF
jgi:hypothetical protein